MQKITYVNVYGETVVFGREPPVLLRSVSGLSRPDAQIVKTQGAYQAGATFERIQLPEREIEVQFDILPLESREALYQERMRIERTLSTGRCMRGGEMGLLIYENDAGSWQTHAVLDGAIAYGKRFRNAMAGNRLTFKCPNPNMTSRGESRTQLRMGRGGFKLPAKLPVMLGARAFRATLHNDGTTDAPMKIVIYGTGESPKLINHTTGAQLIVEQTISTGDRLEIDTDPTALTCRLFKADGTAEDAFGYLDPSVAVSAFLLAPGGNDVEYVPSVASTGSRVEIAWRNVYEGV